VAATVDWDVSVCLAEELGTGRVVESASADEAVSRCGGEVAGDLEDLSGFEPKRPTRKSFFILVGIENPRGRQELDEDLVHEEVARVRGFQLSALSRTIPDYQAALSSLAVQLILAPSCIATVAATREIAHIVLGKILCSSLTWRYQPTW
jgi:hypothetical protein